MSLSFDERLVLRRLVSDARRQRLSDDERFCEHCNEPFTPNRFKPGQRFCSNRCGDAERYLTGKSRREAAQPEVAA